MRIKIPASNAMIGEISVECMVTVSPRKYDLRP
jgi:hypothetical protein